MAQNADGKPHFTYYRTNERLSFVWDGVSDHIEVCPEGYGEPAAYTIPFTLNQHIHPINALKAFQKTCDKFADGYSLPF